MIESALTIGVEEEDEGYYACKGPDHYLISLHIALITREGVREGLHEI